MQNKSESSRRSPPEAGDSRRGFLKAAGRTAAAAAVAGGLYPLMHKGGKGMVWQLDPSKCVQCGRCATDCVLADSAVRCVHAYQVCGYCKLCGGFHQPNVRDIDTAAENQLCPTGAIKRTFVEDPYYEYTIDEDLCIGCGKCVAGCGSFGNGSLYLQVRHNLCVNCNDCSIARNCPAQAFTRVPATKAYLARKAEGDT